MKTTIQSILVAAALLTASATALAAADGVAATTGATSVTEMMQRKHEHQLRDQLVADGRWNEVRQIDEDTATQIREEQVDRYTKANEALDRGSHARGHGGVDLLNECDLEKLHL